MKKYIYKITNLINNKVYIGQSIDYNKRFILNSNLTQKEIALQIGVKRSAITMINIGQNHRRPDVQYPIRNKRVNKNL